MQRNSRVLFRATILVLTVPYGLVVGACRPREATAPDLETVEVGGAVDEGISLVEDERGRGSEPRLSGALPSDFPAEFPVYRPATVSATGETDTGRFVEFTVPLSTRELATWYENRVERYGWIETEPNHFQRESESVRIDWRDAAVGAALRVEYSR